MLQYGWYVDNSKDFSGMTIWKMSIYVHWCCNMGDILIIQTKISGVKNWKMSIYVHLCCSMGDMLIIQMGRKHMSTKWGHILSRVAFEFNCIIGKTHTLCERSGLYIYIILYYITTQWLSFIISVLTHGCNRFWYSIRCWIPFPSQIKGHRLILRWTSVFWTIETWRKVTISGWWFFATPLKNDGVKVSWDDDIPFPTVSGNS